MAMAAMAASQAMDKLYVIAYIFSVLIILIGIIVLSSEKYMAGFMLLLFGIAVGLFGLISAGVIKIPKIGGADDYEDVFLMGGLEDDVNIYMKIISILQGATTINIVTENEFTEYFRENIDTLKSNFRNLSQDAQNQLRTMFTEIELQDMYSSLE